jgi:hypothetical protein
MTTDQFGESILGKLTKSMRGRMFGSISRSTLSKSTSMTNAIMVKSKSLMS